MSDPKALQRLLEELATSGDKDLDVVKAKKVRSVCKSEPAAIPFAHEVIMKYLKRKHAQIRLSAFQLMDMLFTRSHAFRELVTASFQQTVDLVLELDATSKLPPPRDVAKDLMKLALKTIQNWVHQYGSGYGKLRVGFDYLCKVKKVSFEDEEAKNELQRRMEAEKKTKMDNIWRERVKKVKVEMEEKMVDIQTSITELESCLGLLVPSLNNFDNLEGVPDDTNQALDSRAHGIVNTIAINVDPSVTTVEVTETDDNRAIISNLRDQVTLIQNRYLPVVKKWAVTLTKAGDCGDANTLKRVIDLKQMIEEVHSKASDLNILQDLTNSHGQAETDSDDEDDFVDVPEKDHFEVEWGVPAGEPIPSTSKDADVWTCRAPLPSGRLCPRRDRQKCPLHGKLIARDIMGNPANPEEAITEETKSDDWQDPTLLKELEAATGVNLKVPKKGERRKRKTESNLVDIKKIENNSRKRLAKKICLKR